MANQNDIATAVANEPGTSNHNTVDSSGLIDAASDVSEAFTLFPLLPPEIRFMIWEFAMAMEKPRLVHLHARGCGIRGTKRRGCPRSYGLRLNIYGVGYEQVPTYFFVNYECRLLALKHYSIRFSVSQEFSAERYFDQFPFPLVKVDRRATSIVMSPDDILVSWHTHDLPWDDRACFNIQFGPDASLVRNLMVSPWGRGAGDYAGRAFAVVSRLVDKLGNKDAIEKVYFLRNPGQGTLKHGGGSQWSITEHRFDDFDGRDLSQELAQRLEALREDYRPDWRVMDAE
ncbi:hypothetical protein F5B21DRAFT_509322 [Xylaria acuta]|nr:hypothetical protein F5B21DRAFT_509322 [Xylaria acuta]